MENTDFYIFITLFSFFCLYGYLVYLTAEKWPHQDYQRRMKMTLEESKSLEELKSKEISAYMEMSRENLASMDCTLSDQSREQHRKRYIDVQKIWFETSMKVHELEEHYRKKYS